MIVALKKTCEELTDNPVSRDKFYMKLSEDTRAFFGAEVRISVRNEKIADKVGPWDKGYWHKKWSIEKFFEVASLIFDEKFGEINRKHSELSPEQMVEPYFKGKAWTIHNIPDNTGRG